MVAPVLRPHFKYRIARVNWEQEGEELVAAETYGGDTAAEEDEDDEGGALLSVSPASNVLNLVMRDPGTMRFIK